MINDVIYGKLNNTMTFTLQEISEKLELIVGAIMSGQLVNQDWQISTGHLQHAENICVA